MTTRVPERATVFADQHVAVGAVMTLKSVGINPNDHDSKFDNRRACFEWEIDGSKDKSDWCVLEEFCEDDIYHEIQGDEEFDPKQDHYKTGLPLPYNPIYVAEQREDVAYTDWEDAVEFTGGKNKMVWRDSKKKGEGGGRVGHMVTQVIQCEEDTSDWSDHAELADDLGR